MKNDLSENLTPAERLRLMNEGCDAFNRGAFYEAHEFWEEVWNVIDEPERTWIQGMIQVATGLHKLQQGRSDIAIKLLSRGLAKLQESSSVLDGFDLIQLRKDATRIVLALAKGQKVEPKVSLTRTASSG